MADLVVIVPSRGRPEAARELGQAFRDTEARAQLVFAVDSDDPTLPEYDAMRLPGNSLIVCDGPSNMVKTLNYAVQRVLEQDQPFAIGFMGDDHRPRTKHWDAMYLAALDQLGAGIVYGNDLLQGENLPTQVAMTADIVRALGWMAPPALRHLYVDNVWKTLGVSAGCLRYLPGVLVEHMHPFAGKAELDAGYARVNSAEMAGHDRDVYERWLATDAATDIAKVRALRPTADVHEWRLFDEGTVPEFTQPGWYAGREHTAHLEQPGHRDRLMQAATYVAQAAFGRRLRTVVDLGAGDGGLLSLLGPNLHAWGYDLMPANVDAAKERGVDVRLGDVVDGDIDWADIAVCTEMLEHLVDPHAFVRRIGEHCRALVCSSPADERPGRAYEFHTWAFDETGYRNLVEQAGFRVVAARRSTRFQVLLAVRS